MAPLLGTPVYKIGELHTIFYLFFLVLLVYLSIFAFGSYTKNTKKISYFVLCLLLVVNMSSSFTFGVAPEAEVLTFKQRGGESLKDAWYRINDSPNIATKKQSNTIFLRNFYVGITSWNRFILDKAISGNFLEAPVWEALNVMENLVGVPPIANTNNEITLAHIMSKLEKIERDIPSMVKINEIDRKIQGKFNRLD